MGELNIGRGKTLYGFKCPRGKTSRRAEFRTYVMATR